MFSLKTGCRCINSFLFPFGLDKSQNAISELDLAKTRMYFVFSKPQKNYFRFRFIGSQTVFCWLSFNKSEPAIPVLDLSKANLLFPIWA